MKEARVQPALAESAMYLSPFEKYEVMRKVCRHGAPVLYIFLLPPRA